MVIKRGDIFYADLRPVVGSEQGGIRPVLIIQNDVGNKHSPTVICAAITSRMNKAKLPTHIEIDASSYAIVKDSVILLEQLRTIDKRRLKDKVCHLDAEYCRKSIMPFASAWSFLHNLIPAGSFWREILTNVREKWYFNCRCAQKKRTAPKLPGTCQKEPEAYRKYRKLQALHEKQRKKEGIEKVYGRQQRPFRGSHIFCLVYYHQRSFIRIRFCGAEGQ